MSEQYIARKNFSKLVNSISTPGGSPVPSKFYVEYLKPIALLRRDEFYRLIDDELKLLNSKKMSLSKLDRLKGKVYEGWGTLSKSMKCSLIETASYGRIFQLMTDNDPDIEEYVNLLVSECDRMKYQPPIDLSIYKWENFYLKNGEIHTPSCEIIQNCSCGQVHKSPPTCECFKLSPLSHEPFFARVKIPMCRWCVLGDWSTKFACNIDEVVMARVNGYGRCSNCGELGDIVFGLNWTRVYINGMAYETNQNFNLVDQLN